MKTYTFGEIIDILSAGRTAKTEDGYLKLVCDNAGDFYWQQSGDNCKYYTFSKDFSKHKWIIIPKEITALEAIQMIIDGKAPIHENKFGEKRIFAINKTMAWETLELYRLTKGKWYAPDDV
ncbi:hypothetical protein HP398_29885 [Brevibacillus sp. HB1.4B]|uniref:hypothetical protein n=1 Tax=Brevibacillus sp. HB1.4B TaxID=2738845 RepID=UPI00156B96D4|nr:hypothetical protein [Brevibacillus sp. HB1.4B]NRS20634.1 hypothetical protein [Brevibacillus sp. HB1.4B]